MIRRPPRSTLFPLHDALPICFVNRETVGMDANQVSPAPTWSATGTTDQHLPSVATGSRDRKSTRLNSSHANISYAVFCLKKKNKLIVLSSFNYLLYRFQLSSP